MKPRVHPAAWIGLVINFLCMAAAIYTFTEERHFGNLELIFSIAFAAGFVLSLIGVLMLAAGEPAGGIVGMIGSAIYVPIGMICAIGCSISRKNLQFAAFDNPGDAPGPRPQAPDTFNRSDFSANAEPRLAPAYAQSSQASFPRRDLPLAAFPFVDQRWLCGLIIAMVIVGFIVVTQAGRGVPVQMLTPILFGGVLFVMQQRLRGLSVFALYDDALECVPNHWASPVRIPYANIAEVIMHSRKAVVMAKDPATHEERKLTIAFGNIPGDMRDEAKRVLQQKMNELGILTDMR